MKTSYWKNRWQKNNTGWHLSTVYPMLTKVWPTLSVPENATVLIPLCGKSKDIDWLSQRCGKVIGVEVSKKAIETTLDRLDQEIKQDSSHGLTVYRAGNVELWEADILNLPKTIVTPPDVIYDKAAIIALPKERRKEYAAKLLALSSNNTQMLMQIFDYKQHEMDGPPFSVDRDELQQLLGKQYDIRLLHEQSKFNELAKFQQRGLSSYLTEQLFHLSASS